MNGDFIYEINQKGRGRDEYLEIANFTVSDKYIYTIDNYKHCINVFALHDGRFIRSDNVSFTAWDLEAFDDNHFLFTMLKNNPHGKLHYQQPCYAVWQTDSTWNAQKWFIPYKDDYHEMIGKHTYFSVSDTNIIFHSFQNDGYFLFHKTKSPTYQPIKFAKSIDEKHRSDYHYVQNTDCNYLAQTPIINQDYAILSIGGKDYDETVLLTKQTQSFHKNCEANSNKCIIDAQIAWNSCFITYLSDYYLYEELIASGFPRANPQTEGLLKKGGSCLLIYKMKPTSLFTL